MEFKIPEGVSAILEGGFPSLGSIVEPLHDIPPNFDSG